MINVLWRFLDGKTHELDGVPGQFKIVGHQLYDLGSVVGEGAKYCRDISQNGELGLIAIELGFEEEIGTDGLTVGEREMQQADDAYSTAYFGADG